MLREENSRRDLVAIIEMLTALVTSGLEPDAVMKEVVERAAYLTGASGAAIEMAEGDEMVHLAVWGSAAELAGLRVERAGTLSGLCLELSVPLNSVDTATDPRVDAELCARLGVASLACVPLSHGAQTVGVLKVMSPEGSAFGEIHIAMLRLLATVVASAMGQAHSFERPEMATYHDTLTSLRNRRAYDEELPAEMARARRYDRPLSLALLDLQGWKPAGERQGSEAGNHLLRRAAATLRRSLRHVDRCYRVGGSEFAILFPETEREEAQMVTERMVAEVSRGGMGLSVCAGVAELNGWLRPSELHRAAREALIENKAGLGAGAEKSYEGEAGLVEA